MDHEKKLVREAETIGEMTGGSGSIRVLVAPFLALLLVDEQSPHPVLIGVEQSRIDQLLRLLSEAETRLDALRAEAAVEEGS